MKERNMAVWRRNSSRGVIHHVPAIVRRHLGVTVARVERRITVWPVSPAVRGRGGGLRVVGVVVREVLVSSDAVLGVVRRVAGPRGLTTSFCRRYGSGDDERWHQTYKHKGWYPVKDYLGIQQYLGRASFTVGIISIWLVHAVLLFLIAAGVRNHPVGVKTLYVLPDREGVDIIHSTTSKGRL